MKIKGLYAAYDTLLRESKRTKNEPALPWRTDETLDRVGAVKQALNEIEDEIIGLEHSLRDPIQDAEMRAEINASIAMYGNWNDSADDYLHTPMQERLYQESIERSVQYAYDDEHGFYEFEGPCSTCHAHADYDECLYVAGYSTCSSCYDDTRAFALLLSMITNVPIEENRYGEINYVMEDN
jgi:hypothetical protein